VRYVVRFEGEGLSSELRERLMAASRTLAEAARPPANRLLLRRRAESDLERLRAVLRDEGYYAGRIELEIRTPPPTPPAVHGEAEAPSPAPAGTEEAVVIFRIQPGPRYLLGPRRIHIVGPPHGFRPPAPEELGLEPEAPARALLILEAERRLLRRAREEGHAFARLEKRRLVVDHRSRRMEVDLALVPGPKVRFGDIQIVGAEEVERKFLRRHTGLVPGSPFDPRKLERARQRLLQTRLFSTVRITTPSTPGPSDRVPVRIELRARKARSLGGAVGYNSDEGPKLRLFWEHRNLFGAAERLRVTGRGTLQEQDGEIELRKPDFLAVDQNLTARIALVSENKDAFDSLSLASFLGVDRDFGAGLDGAIGMRLRFARIDERGERRNFDLLSLPARIALDRRDNPTDPERGFSLALEAVPSLDVRNPGLHFLRLQATGIHHLPLRKKPRLGLALRGRIGTILGARRDRLPADERFYAGGGGSVRGIPFEKAGALDESLDPLGGRSLLEGAAELRLRPFAKWEFAAFFDAGTVYTSVLPDFDGDLRLGAGLGVRYLTPVGPVRLDVAVPVDRKPEVDDPFQIYLSLGQPF